MFQPEYLRVQQELSVRPEEQSKGLPDPTLRVLGEWPQFKLGTKKGTSITYFGLDSSGWLVDVGNSFDAADDFVFNNQDSTLGIVNSAQGGAFVESKNYKLSTLAKSALG